MIIRTYQRRNRSTTATGSFRDSSSQESFWSSSQEWSGSQEAGLLSSQESLAWSQFDADLDGKCRLERAPSDPTGKKRKQEEDSTLFRAQSALPFVGEAEVRAVETTPGRSSLCRKIGLSLNRRWGFSVPPTSTLMEAQESGEMMEQVDEINFALDGLRDSNSLQVQRGCVLSLLSVCGSVEQRRFLRSHGIAKPLVDAIVSLPTDDPHLALAAASVLYFLASDGRDADFLDSPPCIQFLMKLIQSNPGTSETSDGADVVAKVAEKFKERRTSQSTEFTGPDDLTPRSLALRTIEKACLSAVALDDNTGQVTKVGGLFKERLREMGGLDAICNVAVNCLSTLRGKENRASINMLLKCLRIMENVTFLSEENQNYLLNLQLKNKLFDSPISFIGLVIKTIRALRENRVGNTDMLNSPVQDDSRTETHSSSSSDKDADFSSLPSKSDPYCKATIAGRESSVHNHKELKLRNALQKAKLMNSQRQTSLTSNCQRVVQVKAFRSMNDQSTRRSDDANVFSQDPYDFDDMELDGIKPSIPAPKAKEQTKPINKVSADSVRKVCRKRDAADLDASSSHDAVRSHDPVLSTECILSAVKVLMNLTNDNAAGCEQVAAYDGINAIGSIVASTYPQGDTDSEQNMDLLVAVLGMLVNLVEKDEKNRNQLAVLDLPLPSHLQIALAPGRSMIALLCSLFVNKQGSGAAAEAREGSMNIEAENINVGQREAENMIVEAYTALLLAFLCAESEDSRQAIEARLPSELGLKALVPVLERFVAFHMSLNMISPETHRAVTAVIDSLKQPSSLVVNA